MDRLVIDGNSVGYANHCGTKLTTNGFETQAIIGFLKTLRALKVERPNSKEIVLWDGHAQWRYDLYPGYKADRDKDPKQALLRANYKKARPFIQLALQYLGVRQLTVTSAEADDLAGWFVASIPSTDNIELVTGDGDWLMLVRDNVAWYDQIRDTRVSAKNFFEYTGFKDGRAFFEGKALQGDTSDKINGVGNIGEKKAPLFLAQFGSVQNFFDKCDSGEYVPKLKYEVNFADKNGEGRKIWERNSKLMNLLDVPKFAPEDVVYSPIKYEEEKFRTLCEKLNFMSILANFDNFVRPFRKE